MAREGYERRGSRTPPVVEFAAHLGGFSRGSVRGQVMSCPQRVAHQTVPAAASNDDDHLGRSRGGWRTSLPVVVGIAHPGYRSPKAEPREARALAKRGLA